MGSWCLPLCVWLISLSVCPQVSFLSEHMIESYRGRSGAVHSALKRADHGPLRWDLWRGCARASVAGVWSPPTARPKISGKAAQTRALPSHLHGGRAAGSSVHVTPESRSGESSGSPHLPCWRAAVGSSVPWARHSSQRSHLGVCAHR